jgi:hypothetical protein
MNLEAPDMQAPQASISDTSRPLSEAELGTVAGGRPRVIIIIITKDGETIVIEV